MAALWMKNSFESTKSNSLRVVSCQNKSSGKHTRLLKSGLSDQFIYSKVPGSNPELVLQFEQIDEVEIMRKK